jgi:tetratricopeptide (TPR) repeat protein
MSLASEHTYEAAIKEYNAALRLDPQAAGVYYEIGNCYAAMKKYDDAIAAFTKEQQANGDNEYIETALADAYNAEGMKPKADDAKRKAEQLRKNSTQDNTND